MRKQRSVCASKIQELGVSKLQEIGKLFQRWRRQAAPCHARTLVMGQGASGMSANAAVKTSTFLCFQNKRAPKITAVVGLNNAPLLLRSRTRPLLEYRMASAAPQT